MRTVIEHKLFSINTLWSKSTDAPISNLVLVPNNDSNFSHEVGVFDDYLDVIETLEELELAGLNLGKVKLIAEDGWRCHWLGELVICDRFDKQLFASDRNTQDFFQQLFEQGKYLLLLEGTENELHIAHKIIDRALVNSEIWYF